MSNNKLSKDEITALKELIRNEPERVRRFIKGDDRLPDGFDGFSDIVETRLKLRRGDVSFSDVIQTMLWMLLGVIPVLILTDISPIAVAGIVVIPTIFFYGLIKLVAWVRYG